MVQYLTTALRGMQGYFFDLHDDDWLCRCPPAYADERCVPSNREKRPGPT
jgi:hypothetical protein